MRLQRELLGEYEPVDFVESTEITEAQDLKAHRKLLLSGFLEKTMTALHKAVAARRQTIFETTNFNSSSPKTSIYNQENINTASKNEYIELQNTSTSNLQQPQIRYVQIKLADG